jgi:dihydroorotate dehydrogenase (NAD+) catalytic subunit
MLQIPFYDPMKSYEENYSEGPFGAFADDEVVEHSGTPEHTFLGKKVFLPFGIPAGPLLNSKYVIGAFKKGFDICTYKTVRTRQYGCHPWPNVLAVHVEGDLRPTPDSSALVADNNYTQPLSITNSFGVPSMEPSVWQEDMKKALDFAKESQVMVGSFQGTSDGSGDANKYIEDFVLAAKLVKEAGAPILEANLSCPNEGTANVLCFDTERTLQIAERIKNEIGNTPLILKMAHFADDAKLKDFVQKLGGVADGLSVINTIASAIVNDKGEQALPGKGRERSGVCGTAIKWAGQEMVGKLLKLREELGMKYAVIGVGGVTVPEDFFEYQNLGADAVMSATGAMWNPYLARDIMKLAASK